MLGRYTAQVAAQAAPKLTLLKAKLQRSRSKQELLDGGSGLPPSGRAGSGGVVRGPTRWRALHFCACEGLVCLCARASPSFTTPAWNNVSGCELVGLALGVVLPVLGYSLLRAGREAELMHRSGLPSLLLRLHLHFKM